MTPLSHPTATATATGDAALVEADLGWLLEDFLARVPGTIAAVLGTRDGLCKASAGLSEVEAQRTAAIMSGLLSGTSAIGAILGGQGRARQSVHEHDAGTLFVVPSAGVRQGPAPGGPAPQTVECLLGVLAAPDADAGVIGYQLHDLVRSVPDHLSTSTRGSGQ